jgi:hypothetical protein
MAGDVRVSFRVAAGRESDADLALASAEMLAASRPWRVLNTQGRRFEIWSGTVPLLLANVRFLAGYRYLDRVDADLADVLPRQVPSRVTIGELERGWPGRAGDVRAAVLHLIWRGVFRTGLLAPLSAATSLEQAS